MPTLNIHGAAPGANTSRINSGVEGAMQSAASSPIPGAQMRSLNSKLDQWTSRQYQQAEADAKDALRSTVPWMNPNIAKLNRGLARFEEREAKTAYDQQVREIRQSALAARRINSLREKANREAMAGDPLTFRIQNVGRLGTMGLRAAESGDWRQIQAAKRELSYVEQRHGHIPSVQTALVKAHGRISAGLSGQSPLRRMLGGRLGQVADFAGDALAGEGIGGALLTGAYELAAAPWTIANKANAITGAARPYYDMRRGLAGIGRAGGLNSKDLESALLPSGFNATPDWMSRLGLSAGTSAQLLQRYGIVPFSNNQALGDIKSIAGAEYLPSLGGLGQDTYTRSANFARTTGLASFQGTESQGLDQYFRKLQSVASIAVSQGMDRSKAISNVQSLLASAAGSGASIGTGKRITDMASRMMQGGSAFDRVGGSAASMESASVATAEKMGFGGGQLQNVALGSYVQTHGGTKAFADPSDAALKRLIGNDAYNHLAQTPGGQQQLADLHAAAKTGNGMALNNALGPLLSGNTKAQVAMVRGSVYGQIPGYYGTVAQQRILGVSPQAYASYRATENQPTSTGPVIGGLRGELPRGIRNNNPMNLSYVPGQGAIGSDGRFGVYKTMEQGIAADSKQLLQYQDRDGLNTIRGIVGKWVPPGENNTASYVAAVSKQMGVSADAPLDLHRQQTMRKIVTAMSQQESGTTLNSDTVKRGVGMAYGQPWAGTSAYGTVDSGNDVTATNRAISFAGQASMTAAKTTANTAGAALGSDLGGVAVRFGNVVGTFEGAVGKFAAAVANMPGAGHHAANMSPMPTSPVRR